MKYCKRCVMPDTRPGIKFDTNGICMPCKNYEKQASTNFAARQQELEILCSKYRGKYKNGYDCAIAVSGGKDSYFQVYFMKEVMKMNPILLSVENIDYTQTGIQNLQNLQDVFNCDLITLHPNVNIDRTMSRKAFVEIGSPTWYADALIYAYPYRMTMQLGLHLLVYGENVNYTYGGKYDIETYSAKLQPLNDVVKPVWGEWMGEVTEKDLNSAKQPTLEDCEKHGLNPIYLSYFTHWDSHNNYLLAKRYGFRSLIHEYQREGTIEQYNQIDSISYLLNQWLKYPKFAHASATEMASRWIRSGIKTRDEAVALVKEKDKILDQGIVDNFISFTGMTTREFWATIDKWYNPLLFEKDDKGLWHEKFEVGKGMK